MSVTTQMIVVVALIGILAAAELVMGLIDLANHWRARK